MPTMTRTEFVSFLKARGGCTPAGILTRTEPKMLKTGNPFKSVVRVTRRNGFIGGDYESIVNNKLAKAGEETGFEAQSLPWGQHDGRFFIVHKDAHYLKFFPKATGCEGVDEWFADGNPVGVEAVQAWLPKSSAPASGIAWRTIKLENVVEITVDGQTIILTDAQPETKSSGVA